MKKDYVAPAATPMLFAVKDLLNASGDDFENDIFDE